MAADLPFSGTARCCGHRRRALMERTSLAEGAHEPLLSAVRASPEWFLAVVIGGRLAALLPLREEDVPTTAMPDAVALAPRIARAAARLAAIARIHRAVHMPT